MAEAFFEVHRDLPREGPGTAQDVAWAIERLSLGGPVRVAEAGCGPGADLETLAGLLPEARIEGVDAVAHFVEAAARVARFRGRVSVRTGDMAVLEGPLDLIWCAGALYFLGVTEGLAGWRAALAPGGAVAFSEPVLLSGNEPAAVREFWADYPAITEASGLVDRVRAAGFRVIGARPVVGAGWAAYFRPMAERVARLRPGAGPGLAVALDAAEREIALWQAARDRIAYALVLARPA